MGFSNGDDLNMADSFNTKKLRPLIPRPAITATTTTTSSPYAIHTHGTGDFFPLQDHLGAPEQGKRQLSDHQVSSRWNPTPEQLQVLEDLYRRGIHTPSAEQIRNITTQLRRFGKIEGKNVFYWFQNHKARERQKRRRQTEESIIRSHCNVEILERKETDSSGRGFQVEGCKTWLSATNRNTNVEEPAPTYRAEWLHQHQSLREMHATWHLGSLSSPPDLMNMINSNPSLATAVAAATLSKPKILINEDYNSVDDEEWGQSQTLDLFPVRSDGSVFEEKTQVPASPPMMTITPCHFFEFL